MTAPAHPDGQPWQYVYGSGTGVGACVGVTMDAVLDQIRAGFPMVGDITNLKTPGPVGITLIAGPAVRAGEPVPPPTGTASYVIGLMDDRSFGAEFFRGAQCAGENCKQRENWYFETDADCRPRWVGHDRATDNVGGPHGPCVNFEGTSPWNSAGDPPARKRCDCDWSPQNIAGIHAALALSPPQSCGVAGEFSSIQMTITQLSNLADAELTVSGTGVPFIDGRLFTGKVERQGFSASIDEQVGTDCEVRRVTTVQVDFEGLSNGLPWIGLIESSETGLAGCVTANLGCNASLHLISAN